ncbi:MAG: LysR family transcriptional regulator [Nannocystales bacterium]
MDDQESPAPFDWDDARVFLAAYRCGSSLGAAQRLSVSHSTVRRRLAGLERALNARLFTATPDGLHPTQAAEAALPAAEALERAASTFVHQLQGGSRALQGSLLVTTLHGLAGLIAPSVKRFTERYPQVALTLRCENQIKDLARQEADIAIRLVNTPDETLFGRRIGRVGFGAYAAPSLIARYGRDMTALPWILWDTRAGAEQTERWYAERSNGRAPVLRVTDVSAMLGLARNGVGGAVLPIPLVSGSGLEPVEARIAGFDTDIWCLCHRDARNSERVRAFMHEASTTGARIAAAHASEEGEA